MAYDGQMKRFRRGRLSIYVEPRDIWIGLYVASGAIYVCPLPLLVIKWDRRRQRRPDHPGDFDPETGMCRHPSHR
jgi:hypothetical protein